MIRPFRGVHPQIHPTAYVDPSAQVIGDVHLGAEASIWCNCTVRGDIHYIRLGDRCNIQDNSVIHVRHGTHPVIVNGFCRALGYKRADYRPLLENSGAVPPRKRTRWQKS